MARRRLLLDWVYYPNVGHVVEALKRTKGYYLANKNLDVYLLLNSKTTVELAESCSWIKKTYPVDVDELRKYGEKAQCLKRIPKDWDYIIYDIRLKWDKYSIKTNKVLQKLLKSKIAWGYVGENVLPYEPNPKITLKIPQEAREFSDIYKHNGPAICIMLGGTQSHVQSPSLKMWLKICTALFSSIPNLKIYFTGVTKGVKGRTKTDYFSLKDIDYLIKNLPNAESAYNIGLWNQIALVKKCDIFLSPHTGFAFLAPLVGTPWLALSNCRWPEYVFNNVKFYSVLPECGSYPAHEDTKTGCGWLLAHNKKSLCMTDKLLIKKIPEIVHAAKLLLDPKFTYKKAIRLHLSKITKPPYDFKKFFFLDGVLGSDKQRF